MREANPAAPRPTEERFAAPRPTPRWLGIAVALALLWPASACAGDLVRANGLLRHRTLGIAIRDPAAGGTWRPIDVDGAVAAWRGPAGARMSWLTRCKTPLAGVDLLARHLLIGLEGRMILGVETVALDGSPAHVQRVRATQAGKPVALKTVTRIAGRCVVDFVLVAPGALGEAEADFDRWWSSFRGAPPAPEGAG